MARSKSVTALIIGIGAIMTVMGTGLLERVWSFFGPPDLGPVAFETLERRSVPNDALACPPELCRAKSDLVPPVYSLDASQLKAAMARAVASEPDVTKVEDGQMSDRFIQRTRLMRFPDTIVVRYLSQGENRSTLAIYSRSQLGKGDWGVNKARVERWLAKLSKQAPLAR